jgi:hypothetical protein
MTNCSYAFQAAGPGAMLNLNSASIRVEGIGSYADTLFAGNRLGYLTTGTLVWSGPGAVDSIATYKCEAVLNGLVDRTGDTRNFGTTPCTV